MYWTGADPALPLTDEASVRSGPHRPGLHLLQQERDALKLRVFTRGEVAFAEILRRIEAAQHRIELRSFVWRDDDAGNTLARALLRAANRGVHVHIRKDRIGANYEYLSGSGQSFFHKRTNLAQWVRSSFLHFVYGGAPPAIQRPNVFADSLLTHPNVSFEMRKLFDHSKLFIFDDRYLILGSMGIGDNHRHEWIDLMVEVEGEELVRRLKGRVSGRVPFDPTRRVDFLVHSQDVQSNRTCPMLGDRLALIDAAENSLTIEMAYLGDTRFTAAIVRAVRRGVTVQLTTSAMADVLGDLNRATCDRILRRTGAPDNLTIVLHPRMVHSKLLIVDSRRADIGSANFTPLSHGVYDEVNLYVDDPTFARSLEQAAHERRAEGCVTGHRLGFRHHYFHIERGFIAVLGRRAPRG